MKKNRLMSLCLLSSFLLLSSCAKEAAIKTYNLTFHQTEAGEVEDFVFVVTPGVTIQQDAWDAEPGINPKEGYTAVWEEYNVEEMTSDLTVNPIYIPIEYTATFVNRTNDEVLGTTTFTVEDTTLKNIPALPTLFGYTYAWENYQIEAHDMTVYCDKTPNVHTIKFFEDEEKTIQVGETQEFTIETQSIVEPEVPHHDGFDGLWPEYDLKGDVDLEIVAQYIEHMYYIQFTFEGNPVGNPVGYHFEDTYEDIEKPELPTKTGYTVAWPTNVTLEYGEINNPQEVAAVVTANQYTVSYEGLSETTLVTYDSAYELIETGNKFYGWFNGDEAVMTTGTKWQIAHDVTLTKKPTSNFFKLVDFENEDISLFEGGSNTDLSVVDSQGINGSKALKAECNDMTGQISLKADKDYLDVVFARNNVKSLSFYARGTTATKEFKAQASSLYYEQNVDNFGITTAYKLFYLTRETYNAMAAADNYTFVEYLPGGTTLELYLDNFRVCYTNYTDHTYLGFENGYYYKNSDTNWIFRDGKNNQADFQITNPTGVVGESTISHDVYSEGTSSVKLVKAASGAINLTFGTASNFKYENLPNDGIFVDFRSDNVWNESWHELNGNVTGGGLMTGSNNVLLHPFLIDNPSTRTGVRNVAGAWQTLYLKKSDINTNSTFLILPGGSLGAVYIDNIRFANGPIESFENAYSFVGGLENNVFAGACNYPTNASIGTISDPHNKKDYILTTEWGDINKNTVPDAEISNEKFSDGDYSLKITLAASNPLRLRPSYEQMLIRDGGKLSFDVYCDELSNNHYGFTTLGGIEKTVTKGQWTTVTLEASDFLKSGATKYSEDGRFTENAFGPGAIYFDNIRYIPAA